MNTRKCKICNETKNLETGFYKTGGSKKIYYRTQCISCFCKSNTKYRDKNLLYYENNFDLLPKDVKLSVVLLCLENHTLNYIAKTARCKYNTLWYGLKSNQIENFGIRYIRKNPNNIYGIAIKE
jgi:hypothetical protein